MAVSSIAHNKRVYTFVYAIQGTQTQDDESRIPAEASEVKKA